ncbi:MAG: hypothetical protein H2069_01760 [Legionella sp.]|nr:hypothetical protein [Legionella sp.]
MIKTYPRFGILSGAGPMAGALLYQRVIALLQEKGAWRDGDFPFITLVNLPFSDMLDGNFSCPVITKELLKGLSFLRKQSDYIYIACQTLHAYLSVENIKEFGVVSLLNLLNQALQQETREIQIVASKISRLFNLHGKNIDKICTYIEHQRSENAIDEILKGKNPSLD